MAKKNIYFDYAATTPVCKEAQKAMLPFYNKKYGNTSSMHNYGAEAHEELENFRAYFAKTINAKSEEIYFTASATESNNLALKGVMQRVVKFFQGAEGEVKKNHFIISAIEHDCVRESAKWLKEQGFELSVVPVDPQGFLNFRELEKMIRPETALVSIIHANNEIGTVQEIARIGALCRAKNVLFHTDAAQSYTKLDIDVQAMNIDLLTVSSHKVYGPKGVAFLYVRQGTPIEPIMHGGGHENGLRSSTVNLPAIAGFAAAAKVAFKLQKKEGAKLSKMRDKFIKQCTNKIANCKLNGPYGRRLPNNINLRFEGIEGESLMMELNNRGFAVSTASACSSPKLEPSHVLMALGLSHGEAHGAIRISLGRYTKQKDVNKLFKQLVKAVAKLRKISPFKK